MAYSMLNFMVARQMKVERREARHATRRRMLMMLVLMLMLIPGVYGWQCT